MTVYGFALREMACFTVLWEGLLKSSCELFFSFLDLSGIFDMNGANLDIYAPVDIILCVAVKELPTDDTI